MITHHQWSLCSQRTSFQEWWRTSHGSAKEEKKEERTIPNKGVAVKTACCQKKEIWSEGTLNYNRRIRVESERNIANRLKGVWIRLVCITRYSRGHITKMPSRIEDVVLSTLEVNRKKEVRRKYNDSRVLTSKPLSTRLKDSIKCIILWGGQETFIENSINWTQTKHWQVL